MDNDTGFDDAPHRAQGAQHPSLLPLLTLTVLAVAIPLMVVLVVLCAVVPGLPWWLGVMVGLVAGGVIVAVRLRGAYGGLLSALGAEPMGPESHVRFHNLVQGLSLAAVVGEPDLYVIDDSGRNAAAVAHRGRSAIVATTGLLTSLDRIALEGIVAECLVRIGNGDAESATVGAAMFAPLLDGPLGSLGRLGLDRLLVADRDLAADRAAVALTRYPPGLSAALAAIGAGSPRVGHAPTRLNHVWLVPPSSLDELVVDPTVSVPLSLRIDVLGEL